MSANSNANVFITPADANGVQSLHIEFPDWPRVVEGREAEDAVQEVHVLDLGQPYTFYAAGSFIGLDRGDVGEFDVFIGIDGGPMIYERSLHKEVPLNYDAKDAQKVKYVAWERGSKLRIWLNARCTGANDILRPGQPWSARPHFAAYLWTYPWP